jgi:hypothetical protein
MTLDAEIASPLGGCLDDRDDERLPLVREPDRLWHRRKQRRRPAGARLSNGQVVVLAGSLDLGAWLIHKLRDANRKFFE